MMIEEASIERTEMGSVNASRDMPFHDNNNTMQMQALSKAIK